MTATSRTSSRSSSLRSSRASLGLAARTWRLTIGLTLVAGCAGSIDDPGDYSYPNAGGCDAPTQVLGPRCGGCHSASSALGGLDLASAGVALRLEGTTSTCSGRVLLVPGDPDASYLVAKLSATAPACGNAMPLGGQLPAADLACVQRWVLGLAATDGGSP